MKKLTLIASMFLGGVSMAFATGTVFSCDFSNGLEGFTVYDEDGKQPNAQAINAGFNHQGDSWISFEVDKNYCAASNSSHSKTSHAANDWLITPAVTVENENVFTFDARTASYDGKTIKVGNFSVLLSTSGVAVEDFTVELSAMEMVEDEWVKFGYDLSEYAGQTVYLAIVNNAKSKDALVVDNLFVGTISLAEITPVYTRMQETFSAGQRIMVNMKVGYIENITSIEGTLTCGDFTTQRTITDIDVATGGEYSFQFNEALPIPTPGEPQVFEISLLLNEKETVTATGEIISQAYQPAKRVVFEEQTGTWCGYCPRGHVKMEEMDELYPDTYIGIAAHSGDVMQNYDYSTYLSGQIGTSAPWGRANRAGEPNDPSYFQEMYKTFIETPAYADVAIKADYVPGGTIRLTTTTTFALSANNLETRLEYVVVEDDVNVPGNNLYNQYNNFSGGSTPMGGYENKSNPVPAAEMFYDDVVRRVVADEVGKGIRGSVPTAITKGEAYTHTYEMDVPASVLVLENCEFIALLLDFQTGEVLNAAKCKINIPESVDKVANDVASRVYAVNGNVRVDVNATAVVSVNVYATDGTLVYATTPRQVSGQAVIDCPVANRGVYLVNVVCDGVAQTHKVIL